MSGFFDEFSVAVKKALEKEANTPKLLNADKYLVFESVCDRMEEIFSDTDAHILPEIMHIASAGIITVETNELNLDREKILEFIDVLDDCASLDIFATSQGISFSVKIPELFLDL